MNTSHTIFMADMPLKTRFVTNMQKRPRTAMMSFHFSAMGFPGACLRACVLSVRAHLVPIWYMDGKGPRAELKFCLYNL